MTNLLGLAGKTVAIIGVANRRSVAFAIHKLLGEAGAQMVHIVRDDTIRDGVRPLLGDAAVYCCDVEKDEEITRLAAELARDGVRLDGFVHSIAFANYRDGVKPFHETPRADFLQAVSISCYSLIALARELKPFFNPDAAIVTLSISTTRMASESYGYMGPVKAALDSSVVFLAKSLSADSRIRVNAVGAGLLKTSASAGIPGYIDAYLFAEQVIPRKQALDTREAAATALFLLSPLSSGINAQTIIVDAGMSINYFDRAVVRKVAAPV